MPTSPSDVVLFDVSEHIATVTLNRPDARNALSSDVLRELPRRLREANDRHRVKGELHELAALVSHGVEPDDVVDPGAEWKPTHHHDADRAIKKLDSSRRLRHWKRKDWKRRTVVRRQKNAAWRRLADTA